MLFDRRFVPAIVIGLADVFAIGFGMGVPVFAILLGFGVGWWFVRRTPAALQVDADVPRASLRALLSVALGLALASFFVLLVVWGPHIPKAFDPAFEAAEWGIPLILYTSRASIVGWLVLMVVISPALQFMAVVTGGLAGLATRSRRTQ